MHKIVFFLSLFAHFSPLLCQSSKDSTSFRQNFGFEATVKHIAFSNDKPVFNSSPFRFATDNPFTHLALFSSFNYYASYNKKYFIDARILAEQRSHSGGNNYIGNLVLFPMFKFTFIDTFSIFNKNIAINGKGGDLWNEDWLDNLRLYNIDFNGLDLNVAYKKIKLGYSRIADLSNNIGLNIEENFKYYLVYTRNKNKFGISLERNFLLSAPALDYNITLLSEFVIKEKSVFKLQLNKRINGKIANNNLPAIFAGVKLSDYLSINARFYPKEFNQGFKDLNRIRYRGSLPTPYVGLQLYPLKNYFRNLNQWAFFTERSNIDILNFEVIYHNTIRLTSVFSIDNRIDFNLNVENKTLKFYPLYDVGVALQPIDKFKFRFSLTNKIMNLDNYYQTFYLLSSPSFSIELIKYL